MPKLIQSKVQYLRIVVTNSCNMSCRYCHKEGMEYINMEMHLEDIVKVVRGCYNIGFRKFKLMGGEPTARRDILNLVKAIREIADDIDLSMISNGLCDCYVFDKCFENGLNRLNISVHGWGKEHFINNTKCSEKQWSVFRKNIEKLAMENRINKVNYVIKKGNNEKDLMDLISWCSNKNLFIDILNLLYDKENKELSYLKYEMEEIEKMLHDNFEIVKKEIIDNPYSLPSTRYKLKSGGSVNLKTSELNKQNFLKACKTCKEYNYCTEGIKALRLSNNGIIQPCLFRKDNSFVIKESEDVFFEEKLLRYIQEL